MLPWQPNYRTVEFTYKQHFQSELSPFSKVVYEKFLQGLNNQHLFLKYANKILQNQTLKPSIILHNNNIFKSNYLP